MNGPAPTGVIENFWTPILFMAVGEAIQLGTSLKNAWMIGAKTVFMWSTTVYWSGVVIVLIGKFWAQPHASAAAGAKSRWMLNLTAAALKGVPSVNLTP